jgi:hypothetical protein
VGDIDRMDKMIEAIQAEVTEKPPTAEVEVFFKLLKASEEPLYEHTEVTLLVFITRLMAIKSKYFFSNNCYNDLVKLISDILPKPICFRSLTKCLRTVGSLSKLFTLIYTFLSTLLLILYPSQVASDDLANDFINNHFNSSGGGSTGGDPWYSSEGGSTDGDSWYY